jgi:Secretion system C-terminal sorting domain
MRFFLTLFCTAFVISISNATRAQIADSLLTGNCAPAISEDFLDIGNVRARILNNGALFLRGNRTVYEVPKGSGKHSMYISNLWIGGLIDGELRTAGTSFSPYEFWSGPIDESGRPPDDCSEYDRIWSLNYEELVSTATNPDTVAEALHGWPTHLGAPYAEFNNVSGFQPGSEDMALILGDQMLWWVMNDRGNVHARGGTLPLGIEVRAAAYAFDRPGTIGNSTFYQYTVINKNDRRITDAYIGIQSDVDVGWGKDDRVGTDTTLGMVYGYNGYPDDGDGPGEYGTTPPAIGLMTLPSRHQPGRTLDKFSHTMWSVNGGGALGDASNGEDIYNYLRSRWRNGLPLTVGGNGFRTSNIVSNYIFPGDPTVGAFWSALNNDDEGSQEAPLDTRMIGSFGPIDLSPGDTVSFSAALVWSRGSDYMDSVSKLFEDAAFVRSRWDAITTPRFVEFRVPPTQFDFAASIYPNPATSAATLRYSIPRPMEVRIEVFDVLGRRLLSIDHGLRPGGEYLQSLPATNWSPGLYLVRIQLDYVSATRKLVVQ